jgi:hypothetical protein
MLARLGDVLYWAATLAAGLVLMLFVSIQIEQEWKYFLLLDSWYFVGFAVLI